MAGSVIDRRAFLGGTDTAAILGVSPWKTAYDLWEEKTALELVPPPADEKREKLLRRGKKLEPYTMELVEEETGIFIHRRNQRYTDPEYEWMAAEVDFEFIDDQGQLCSGEIKTISPFAASEWGEQYSDQIPLHYLCQVMWGLMITGRPLCLVAALIGADDLRVYEVKRDNELIAEIRRRAVHFWTTNVLKKKAPEPQTISDTNKILFKLGGALVPGGEVIWNKISAFKKAKEEEKAAKQKRDSLELDIKTFLTATAEIQGLERTPERFTVLGPDGRRSVLTCSLQRRSAYSVPACEFFVIRT